MTAVWPTQTGLCKCGWVWRSLTEDMCRICFQITAASFRQTIFWAIYKVIASSRMVSDESGVPLSFLMLSSPHLFFSFRISKPPSSPSLLFSYSPLLLSIWWLLLFPQHLFFVSSPLLLFLSSCLPYPLLFLFFLFFLLFPSISLSLSPLLFLLSLTFSPLPYFFSSPLLFLLSLTFSPLSPGPQMLETGSSTSGSK